jgi:hypothetical protein
MSPIPEAQPSAPSPATETAPFEVFCSRHFTGWLADERLSLAFTLIGLNPAAGLSIFNRTLSRCMGLWGDGQTLYLSTLFQLWRFENSLGPGEIYRGYDRLYVPQLGWTTGDLDIHDIAVDSQGCPVFANTLFSCLATVSEWIRAGGSSGMPTLSEASSSPWPSARLCAGAHLSRRLCHRGDLPGA